MFRRLIYTSVASTPFQRRELVDLLQQSRGYNHADEITGLLLHDRGRFLQVIEGSPEAVSNLLERLSRDPRHDQFEVHRDGPTNTRLFPDWSMGLGDLSDPALAFLPGMVPESQQKTRLQWIVERIPELAEKIGEALRKSA